MVGPDHQVDFRNENQRDCGSSEKAAIQKSSPRGTSLVKQLIYFGIPSGDRPRGLSFYKGALVYGFQKKKPDSVDRLNPSCI